MPCAGRFPALAARLTPRPCSRRAARVRPRTTPFGREEQPCSEPFGTSARATDLWLLFIPLIIGLAGFGIGAGGGISSTSIAKVGSERVTADDYIRAMQQELRALTQQLGRDLSITEARQYGIDRMVLARLVNDAALDNEAARLGLSASDETIHDQVVASPGFHGADGSFSRDAYAFALERAGLRPAEFEALLRREAGRELVAASAQAAATMPAAAADTVLAFLGERRTFDWLRLDPSLLPAADPRPDRRRSPVPTTTPTPSATPAPRPARSPTPPSPPTALAATIELPDADLRAAYDADLAHYQTPERRALDRIAFATDADAEAAKARLDKGEVTFDALATERGLQPADIDQGTVTADSLSPEARDAVFGAAGPGIVGPVPTPLGPSLYRINAVLAASTRSFEDAKAEIAERKALEQATAQIHDETAAIEDLLAGGAKAEEIASETAMELGTLALDRDSSGGLADDPAFVSAANAARQGEETDLIELADGGLATLRVDAIVPPAPIPLAEIRDRVAADWTAERTAEALAQLADGYAERAPRRPRLRRPRRAPAAADAGRRPPHPRRDRPGRAGRARRRRLRRRRTAAPSSAATATA